MTVWTFVTYSVQFITLAGVGVLWMKLHRPAKEDPRLSKGLQLLQAKISILEDLSDRTETQVKQLSSLLEQKSVEVQMRIEEAEKHVHKVQHAMSQSMEVAAIFQDKIPHHEIIERESSRKYIQAAQMAHHGASAQEISQQLGIDFAEADFIAKVNRERLMFAPESLPQWAQSTPQDSQSQPSTQSMAQAASRFMERDYSQAFQKPANSQDALKHLGNQFRMASQEFQTPHSSHTPSTQSTTQPTIQPYQPQPIHQQQSQQQPQPAPIIAKTRVLSTTSELDWAKGHRPYMKEVDSSKVALVKFPRVET